MSLLRKTSSYLVLIVTDHPDATIDDMVERSPAPVEQTAKYTGMAGIRFRCETNENVALNIALQIAHGRQFVLRTGYGVNQREIAQ